MKCTRCQTDLPDSATFCPKCGSSVSQDQPAPFSYLPTGAPPWPTNVPAHLLSTSGATSSQLAKQSEVQPLERPKRSTRSIIGMTALLICIPLLAAALTLGVLYMNGQFPPANAASVKVHLVQVSPTPNATQQSNQLSNPRSFQSVVNKDVNVSLQSPTDWQEEPSQKSSEKTFFVLHPAQQNGIGIIIARFSPDTSSVLKSADDLNQQMITGLGNLQDVHNLQLITPSNSQPTLGGTQWVQKDGIYLDSQGNKMHISTLAVQHKQEYYNILVFIPDVYYNEAMQKYIQPMFQSLKFLS